MELQEAILRRRSVRKFTEEVVTDEELRQIFESVRWAPSWANTQAWEFIIVREKTLIEKITGTYADKNPAIKGSLAASALVVACANTAVYGFYDSKDATATQSWYMFDLGLAVQTLCLKAHEMGLGTVVVGLMNQEACKKILAVPENHEVVVVIPIGRPVLPLKKDGPPRKAVSEMVYLNQFGKAMF